MDRPPSERLSRQRSRLQAPRVLQQPGEKSTVEPSYKETSVLGMILLVALGGQLMNPHGFLGKEREVVQAITDWALERLSPQG